MISGFLFYTRAFTLEFVSGFYAKVNTIDCTNVVNGAFALQHSYYLDVDRVVRDIDAVLADQLSDEIKGRETSTHSGFFRLK